MHHISGSCFRVQTGIDFLGRGAWDGVKVLISRDGRVIGIDRR